MKEKSVWTIQRSILILVLVAFDIYALFFKPECGIDNAFLSCVLKGTWGDWIGVPLFHLGALTMMGVFPGLKNMVSPVGSASGNYMIGAVLAVSIILFWLF